MEVVGWNDKSKCNVWAEKSKKYSPSRSINTYQLVESIKNAEDWDRVRSLAKKLSKSKKNDCGKVE